MGHPESPSRLVQSCSPVVDETWRKRTSRKDAKVSFNWAFVNLAVAALVYLDMCYSVFTGQYQRIYPSLWYIELTVVVVVLMAVLWDVFTYFSFYVFSRPVEITQSQKELLGIGDNDPGFVTPKPSPRTPESERSPFSSIQSVQMTGQQSPYTPTGSPWGTYTPTNVGPFNSSYNNAPSPSNSYTSSPAAGHLTFGPNTSVQHGNLSTSMNYSPGAPMTSLDGSGIRSRLSMSFRSPSPSDKMTDLQSLSLYLREQEEKEHRASLSSQDISFGSPSFWSYGRPSMDYSHLIRKNQYQLASRSPQSHKSTTDDTDNMGEEVWRPLGVMDDDLYLWIERLRKWLGQTIMIQLAREIENINSQLRKIGCEDTEIGEVGVSTLKQLALTKGSHVPTLNVMVPYLDFSSNQEYLIKRIKDLGSDGCLGEYSWSSGGSRGLYGKVWGEHLPTDARLVMHVFCTYLDARLPREMKYPDGKTFTSQHFLKTPDKPNLEKDNLLLFQSSINPPHFQVVIKDTIYSLPKGRNNMFHAILFFLYHVKTKERGMLGRVNLGMSGVNILSVLDD